MIIQLLWATQRHRIPELEEREVTSCSRVRGPVMPPSARSIVARHPVLLLRTEGSVETVLA